MTGAFCLKALFVLIGAWLLIDLYAYLRGQSLSQWVIKLKQNWFSRILILSLILVAASFLIIHFELLR
jgi:hypothetical protein